MVEESDGTYNGAFFDAGTYLDLVETEGRVLLKTAEGADPGAAIAFCPDWTVGDLVPHLGFVYRWAGELVGRGLADPPPRGAFFDTDPGDPAGALERTRAAHENLVRTLRDAPTDLDCWRMWPGSGSARDFWIRRMLHETLVHGVDAARGASGEAAGNGDLDDALATDGIDEMICGFAVRYSKNLRSERPMSIAIRTDSGLSWWVRVNAEAPLFGRGLSPFGADVEVSGPPAELYLFLWNRRTTDGLRVAGSPEPLEAWARGAHL